MINNILVNLWENLIQIYLPNQERLFIKCINHHFRSKDNLITITAKGEGNNLKEAPYGTKDNLTITTILMEKVNNTTTIL